MCVFFIFVFFLINCWSSVVASGCVATVVPSPLFQLFFCSKVHADLFIQAQRGASLLSSVALTSTQVVSRGELFLKLNFSPSIPVVLMLFA